MAYPVKQIVDGVRYVEIPDLSGFSSVFLVGDEQDAILIDCHVARTAPGIADGLEAAGVNPSSIRGIVITHGHQDHFGGAAHLAKWSGAPLWSHLHTALQLEDTWGYFASPGCWVSNSRPRDWGSYNVGICPEPVRVDRILREGDSIEVGAMRFEVLHIPGHDRGQVGLWEPRRRYFFCGDLIQGGMDAAGNWLGLYTDTASQRQSLQRVAELNPQWLFKGHRIARNGESVQQDLAAAIKRLDDIESCILETLENSAPASVHWITGEVFRRLLGLENINFGPYAVVSVHAFLLDLGRRGILEETREGTWRKTVAS